MLGVFRAIRPAERRDTWTAFAFLFGLVASHAVLETARDALFLSKVSADRLPLVYLAIAATTLVVNRAQDRLTRGMARKSALTLWTASAAVVTAGLWAATTQLGTPALYALYVWSGVVTALVLIHFWTLLGDLFSVTQAKRVYGVVGAGSVLGAIVGSAAAAALATAVAAPWLLLVAALGFGISAGLTRRLTEPAVMSAAPEDAAEEDGPQEGLRVVAQWVVSHPYVRWVALVVVLGTAALTVGDFVFKSAAAREVPADELGRFFGVVYLVLNSLSLVAQLGLVGFLLRRFDLSVALSVLPVLLLLGGLGVVATASLAAVLLVKGADGALKHSLHRTAVELLFVPLSERARARAKAFVDVVGQRGGQALASLGILAITAAGGGASVAAIGLVGLAGLWLFAAARLRAPYLALFRNRLRLGWSSEQGFGDLDVASLETLVAALDSEDDAEVLAALDVLEREDKGRLVPGLILYHPSDEVVERALRLFSRTGRDQVVRIIDRILEHGSPRVRAAGLAARTALAPSAQKLRLHLSLEESPEVRAMIMVNLIAAKEITGTDAQDALRSILDHGTDQSRVGLAEAIGLCGATGFESTLLELLEQPGREVQRATIEAMGQLNAPAFLPALIDKLGVERLRRAVRVALTRFGEPGVQALEQALEDPDRASTVRWEIPLTLTRLGDPTEVGARLLARLPEERDGMVRYRIIAALETMARRLPDLELDAEPLDRAIADSVGRAYRYLDRRLILVAGAEADPAHQSPGHGLLLASMADKQAHTVDRLFRLLGLRYPQEGFREIQRSLASPRAKTRGAGLELVENILKPPLRGAVMGLVDDVPDAQRGAAGAGYHTPLGLDYEGLLEHMLSSPSQSVQAMTAYHIAELRLSRFVPALRRLVDEVGLEDARRALEQLEVAHAG